MLQSLTAYSTTNVELTTAPLAAMDVFTIMHSDRGEDEIAVLRSFVESGGGLVIAAEGWIWQWYRPQDSLVGVVRTLTTADDPAANGKAARRRYASTTRTRNLS